MVKEDKKAGQEEAGSAKTESATQSSAPPAKDAAKEPSQTQTAEKKPQREDPPDDPLEERRVIKPLIQAADKNSKIGDLWYLVPLKWWKAWKLYSDYEERDDDHNAQPPGEIDNSALLERVGTSQEERLKHGLLESVDYHLLPAAAWKKLHAWYGGGPVISRKMIGVPVAIGGRLDLKLEVEVYLTVIRLYRADAPPGTPLRLRSKSGPDAHRQASRTLSSKCRVTRSARSSARSPRCATASRRTASASISRTRTWVVSDASLLTLRQRELRHGVRGGARLQHAR